MISFKKRIFFLVLAFLPFGVYFMVARVLHVDGQNTRGSVLSDGRAGANGTEKGVVVEDLHGFMVWSSNRYGNHELVKMTFPEKKIVRLTNNPLADTFPRISPDGKKLAFTRAQKMNVSLNG